PTNFNGCNPWPAGTFNVTGETKVAAVISRGSCEFGVKVLNAERAGAEFVVVYNHAAGGDTLTTMGAGSVGDQTTIPSIFIWHTKGLQMVDWYDTHGTGSEFTLDMRAYQAGNTADVVISFSSRGPGVGNVLKPDIAAPGVNILSQGYTPNAEGEARHLGYGQVSGTSMAAPHVAGAAALLQQVHPNWTPAEIKSALMSTAKYMDIWTHDGMPAQPLDMGAGRLDLERAADPGVILDPPSLGFGHVATGTIKSMVVTVRNITDEAETYALSTLYTGDSFTATTSLPGFTVTPASLTLPAHGEANVIVRFDSALGWNGDNQGYLIMDGSDHHAHMPLWARVTNPAAKTDILIIDNDGSSSLGLPNYRGYYTRTVSALGYSYTILNVDALAGTTDRYLDPAALVGYDAILYFTGDNFYPDGSFSVPTPLTENDMYALNQYAQNGGTIIAMGQDLSTVLASDNDNPEFFYNFTLGGTFLTDTVGTGVISPTFTISSTSALPLAGVRLDLSEGNWDGADNQYFVDEIESGVYITDDVAGSPTTPNYQAVLQHRDSTNVDKGTVAMVHREQPTLENPGVTFTGRTFYATFGLEGVNTRSGFTTREELIQRALNWAWDNPQVEIEATTTEAGQTTFVANFSSNIPGVRPIKYRWDFGDGPTAPTNNGVITLDTSTCSNDTTVRVEVLDSLGNRTVNTITAFCPEQEVFSVYLPVFIK
ncbi:MAG: S8 family serine peptidase, partial [Ardenticatenales bacterium]|nr:S8 family serine peptidase [Ardenticatenales bacterium]